jgi:hypothetical protein
MKGCQGFLSAAVLTLAVLLPNLGSAQVYQSKTPSPPVSAQYEAWQFNDEPILVNGLIYYPTRERRFFDGEIMSQVGVYRHVPVYADVTLEPHSVVYLPIGRQSMRGYERRREGELAGTTGSRMPAFPVEVASSITTMPRELRPEVLAPIGTSGTFRTEDAAIPAPAPEVAIETAERPNVPRPARTNIESIPQPRENNGVWLEYAGSRWYSDGPAAVFDPNRFIEIGNYRGFPVYRDKSRGAEEIWVRVVAGGPVAPYAKR